MTRFRIDEPGIDIEALQARIEAAITAKRGVRFSDRELDELRSTPLRPRLRREDLPRGLMWEISSVRRALPEVPEPPPTVPASVADAGVRARSESAAFDVRPPEGRGGPTGRLAGLRGRLRRLLGSMIGIDMEFLARRPLVDTLAMLRDDLGDRARREDDRVIDLLEGSFDVLKDNLDGRMDRVVEWAGKHLSAMTGQLDERGERQLHLLHNLVFELSHARLDLRKLQDEANEMARRIKLLEERERALEGLVLPGERPADRA